MVPGKLSPLTCQTECFIIQKTPYPGRFGWTVRPGIARGVSNGPNLSEFTKRCYADDDGIKDHPYAVKR